MRKMINRFAFIALYGWISVSQAQPAVENGLLWKVYGKNMHEPSYLFGTFHLMGAQYVDSLTNVVESFQQCRALVGEILLDSSITVKLMIAAQLEGTTLDKLMTPADYEATATWFRQLSGAELSSFKTMNPATIQNLIMAMLQQKYHPSSIPDDPPMDLYLQQLAKRSGKSLVALEDIDIQINALFKQFPLDRQAKMLSDFVRNRDKALLDLRLMNTSYKRGELYKLEELLAEQSYTKEESATLLDERNEKWMEKLPALFRKQSTFVAVGALHLAGENGLISLLRKAGYQVTSVPVN